MTEPVTASPETQAARQLFDCLQRLGAQGSNPVLEVLVGAGAMELERKYPDKPLRFGGGRWRAFYHSHDYPQKSPDEHGHFHLFLRMDDGGDERCWSHVAALVMDHLGQPRYWRSVNRWVTDDCWQLAPDLIAHMAGVGGGGETLLEAWLAAMVGLYGDDLAALLRRRDEAVAGLLRARGGEPVSDDKGIYGLGEAPVDLLHKLDEVLNGHSGNTD